MQHRSTKGLVAVSLFTVLSTFTAVSISAEDLVAKGKAVVADKKKGNCAACHVMAGADMPGEVGPPLVAMKARWPKKEELRKQIADSRAKNPNSMMPPFGTHGILTDAEIDAVTEYIYTL